MHLKRSWPAVSHLKQIRRSFIVLVGRNIKEEQREEGCCLLRHIRWSFKTSEVAATLTTLWGCSYEARSDFRYYQRSRYLPQYRMSNSCYGIFRLLFCKEKACRSSLGRLLQVYCHDVGGTRATQPKWIYNERVRSCCRCEDYLLSSLNVPCSLSFWVITP